MTMKNQLLYFADVDYVINIRSNGKDWFHMHFSRALYSMVTMTYICLCQMTIIYGLINTFKCPVSNILTLKVWYTA